MGGHYKWVQLASEPTQPFFKIILHNLSNICGGRPLGALMATSRWGASPGQVGLLFSLLSVMHGRHARAVKPAARVPPESFRQVLGLTRSHTQATLIWPQRGEGMQGAIKYVERTQIPKYAAFLGYSRTIAFPPAPRFHRSTSPHAPFVIIHFPIFRHFLRSLHPRDWEHAGEEAATVQPPSEVSPAVRHSAGEIHSEFSFIRITKSQYFKLCAQYFNMSPF